MGVVFRQSIKSSLATFAGAFLGGDIKTIIGGNKETINTFIQTLEKELKLEEESQLINQIIETHKTIEYDIAVEALKNLLQELKYK